MILINKDTHILTPYKEFDITAIDKEIKSLEHIREMLIDFFGDRVYKCSKCINNNKTLRNNGAGYVIGNHFTITVLQYKSKSIAGELCIGEHNDSYIMQLKVAAIRGLTPCRINGVAMVEKLKNGDNLKEWIDNMKKGYDAT